jgi:hypothetical protein
MKYLLLVHHDEAAFGDRQRKTVDKKEFATSFTTKNN